MMRMTKYLAAAMIAVAVWACGGNPRKVTDGARSGQPATSQSVGYRQFAIPSVPAAVPPAEQAGWLREHFWDGFEFADTAYVAAQDTAAMIRAFALYAVQAVDPGEPSPMGGLMERAEVQAATFRYFLFLAGLVLHDPNSQLRNDELYIPVLERAVASPLLSEAEKIAPRHALHMARQNRIGHQANDFAYTDIDGRTATLLATRAEWTLLFFSNPGCPLCAELTQLLKGSPVVGRALSDGRLKIIVLYPDDDLDAWRQHSADIPPEWIYARDTDFGIRDRQLYDLKAIPALYLLDSLKRVVVKDASDVRPVEYLLSGVPAAETPSE